MLDPIKIKQRVLQGEYVAPVPVEDLLGALPEVLQVPRSGCE